MRIIALAFTISSALFVLGCSPPPAGGVDQRVAALEKQVATASEQNRDLRAKLRIRNSFPTQSPLDAFFASPEFWQCTYDSSWSDCASRCAKQTAEHRKVCAQKPTDAEKLKCFEDASASGAACLKACPVQSSPTNPLDCSGGGPA